YFIANFSGPIRSAGTTATCVALMLIDFLREHFGFAKYDATEKEVKRYVTENFDYHERINNLQYLPTVEEIEFLARNIPIQISGDPSERKEVSNYRDLERVKTNFIRGGMCLAFSEGLAQKAAKGLLRLKSPKKNGLKCTGFDFLEEYVKIHKKRESGDKNTSASYIEDAMAGRPVFSYPSRSGGFRFRYGRSRVAGFSAVSVHPATMGITNGFLSNGTQLKLERPTKGCIVTSCDSIDGPIVKLKNGSVRKIKNYEEAKKIYEDIEEIIYLGDILFPLGDVIDRNAELPKCGYVEEWWKLDVEEKDEGQMTDCFNVSFEEAVEMSEKFKVPIHPSYIFYWSQISKKDFEALVNWLAKGKAEDGRIVLPFGDIEGKRALELLGVEHEVLFGEAVIEKDARGLLLNLGINGELERAKRILDFAEGENVLEIVNSLCKYKIKDKAGSFIGARMGRPEKAKLRKLPGSPNVLFPVSSQGGRLHLVSEAVASGSIYSKLPIFYCDCGNETIYPICEKCGKKTCRGFCCRICKKTGREECSKHLEMNDKFCNKEINLKYFFEMATASIGYKKEEVLAVRGIEKSDSKDCDIENLAKGILRAKYNLSVNRDGTIRYDGVEIPLTHFKPFEIRTSVGKLRELGYEKDINGDEVKRDDQILELFPHDVILPSCPETSDDRADEVFLNIANFIDEELEKFYKLPRYYNLKTSEDLVGQLVVCMAPHNCAGVIGRIIGFNKLQGLTLSPYMHAAIRRDCDGDEAAVMCLMDVLLNFSRKFLSGRRGGTQDAPLILNSRINAGEVDDQILRFELCDEYPLEVYRLAEKGSHSRECRIETVQSRLEKGEDCFTRTGFTHNTTDINSGVLNGAYKILPTMKDKVLAQMELVKKIRAVDSNDVARMVVERHLIRDIRGNLRKFARQQFRCSKCNEKYRRPPLSGVCKCGGKLIFTISEGSIKKYLGIAEFLVQNFEVTEYTRASLELTREYIEEIFGVEERQEKL
ncbi:MAG: DNA polymerase II large subunit, partial [Nanoarchaeota archaeon]|nr:DNA polymerase II large subunit [Nanoarchaeota archaeon]